MRTLLAAGNPWFRATDLVGCVRSANGDTYNSRQILAIAARVPSVLMIEDELVRIRTLRPDLPDGIEARCAKCWGRFLLAGSQLVWLAKHHYPLPRWCQPCRQGNRADDLRAEAVRARADANAAAMREGLAEHRGHGKSAPSILSQWEPGEGPGTPGGCLHGLPYEACRTCRGHHHG